MCSCCVKVSALRFTRFIFYKKINLGKIFYKKINLGNPTATAGYAHLAGVIDTLQLMRDIPLIAGHIPPVDQWEGCGLRILEDAHATLVYLTSLPAFSQGPKVYPEIWKYAVKRLIVDGAIVLKGIEVLAGRHMQHVALVAAQQQLFADLVVDGTLPSRSRARLRSCAALGAGNWLKIVNIPEIHMMDDAVFVHALRKRLGLNAAAVMPETRCRAIACHYGPDRVTTNPPCYIRTGLETARFLSAGEHLLGVHWDSCKGGGSSRLGTTLL